MNNDFSFTGLKGKIAQLKQCDSTVLRPCSSHISYISLGWWKFWKIPSELRERCCEVKRKNMKSKQGVMKCRKDKG